MPLFQRRQQREQRAADAVAGRPRQLATRFPREARAKLVWATADNVPAVSLDIMRNVDPMTFVRQQAAVLVRDWGTIPFRPESLPDYLTTQATDAQVVDIVESWFVAAEQIVGIAIKRGEAYGGGAWVERKALADAAEAYRARVNEILDDHDMAWQLMGDQMIPRSSIAMHATVVEPVLSLTGGDARFASVEKAYQKALSELKTGGDASDAITDAGTALQEMLMACGAKGNALGPLLADARKRELLTAYDTKLADAIQALGEWVSADRSGRGDAHRAGEASTEDAWLAVRVAGALILRLGAGRKR